MKTPQAEGWSRGEFLRGLTVVVTAGLLCILFCGGCTFSYQPPFAPIIFSIDENFNVTISSEATIVTSLGTISIGASFKLPKKNGTTVILRNVKLDLDKAYLIEVNHGLEAIANGKTKIIIQDKKVLIDVKSAKIETIEFWNVTTESIPEYENGSMIERAFN